MAARAPDASPSPPPSPQVEPTSETPGQDPDGSIQGRRQDHPGSAERRTGPADGARSGREDGGAVVQRSMVGAPPAPRTATPSSRSAWPRSTFTPVAGRRGPPAPGPASTRRSPPRARATRSRSGSFSIRARGNQGYISDLLWSRSGPIRLDEVASFPGTGLLFAVGTGAAASWGQRGGRSHQDHDLGSSDDPRRRSASAANSATLRPLGTSFRRSGADRAFSDAVGITRPSAPPCPGGTQCRRSTSDAGSWRACAPRPRRHA